MNDIQKLYTCECSASGVTVSYDDEAPEVFITGWMMSPGEGKMSFRERLRWCWHLLRTGKPFNDHLILNFETARQMSFDILKNTAEISEKKIKEQTDGKPTA
jgi:hypothetical protein